MNMRRICVFGAGAIGGYLAAKLAAAGHQVSVVAPTLEAVHAVTARLAARKGLYSSP